MAAPPGDDPVSQGRAGDDTESNTMHMGYDGADDDDESGSEDGEGSETVVETIVEPTPAKKKRGRPAGSKNKTTGARRRKQDDVVDTRHVLYTEMPLHDGSFFPAHKNVAKLLPLCHPNVKKWKFVPNSADDIANRSKTKQSLYLTAEFHLPSHAGYHNLLSVIGVKNSFSWWEHAEEPFEFVESEYVEQDAERTNSTFGKAAALHRLPHQTLPYPLGRDVGYKTNTWVEVLQYKTARAMA